MPRSIPGTAPILVWDKVKIFVARQTIDLPEGEELYDLSCILRVPQKTAFNPLSLMFPTPICTWFARLQMMWVERGEEKGGGGRRSTLKGDHIINN